MQATNRSYQGHFNTRSRSGRPFIRKPFRADASHRRNSEITAKQVRLIDSEGNNHGIVDIVAALSAASEANLDLVELSGKVDPPVCKIVSWSKFIYEQKKKEKDARKNKQKDMKEFRFGVAIGQGDKDRLITRVKTFLDKGHNVKVTVVRKRRAPLDQAKALLNDLLTQLSEYSSIDPHPSIERRNVSIIMKGLTESEASRRLSHAKIQDKKNSVKKVQDDESPRRKREEDPIQQKQAGASSDQKNGKTEE